MIEQMVKAFEGVVEQNASLVAKATPDTFDKQTPCSSFNVKGLLNHIVGGNHMFATIAAGGKVETSAGAPDLVGNDPSGAYLASKEAVLGALRDPASFERNWEFPFGTMPAFQGLGIMLMESTVHGWDLAKALGQDATIDPTLATMILEGAKQGINPEFRNADGNPFALAIDVPDDASPTDKLVAFLGRKP